MALSHSRTEDIPKDAVVLTKDQALTYQWKIISNWTPTTDVWALRYTPGVLGTLTAFAGAYVNNHYRKKLKLGQYGRLTSYLPIVVIPGIFSVLTHKMFVQRSLLLDSMENCPICLQLRAAMFQCGSGALYPTVLAPLSAFMFATRHYTYRLPDIVKEPKEVLILWKKLTRPIFPVIGTTIAVQACVAMYLTYKEMYQSLRVLIKLQQMDEENLNSEFDTDNGM